MVLIHILYFRAYLVEIGKNKALWDKGTFVIVFASASFFSVFMKANKTLLPLHTIVNITMQTTFYS